MTRTADWKGSIGFQLGNKLYVNMTGNVNDPVYLEGKVGLIDTILMTRTEHLSEYLFHSPTVGLN